MRVSEIVGARLDYWVAMADGVKPHSVENPFERSDGTPNPYCRVYAGDCGENGYHPSTNWAHGGPLIDKFNVDVVRELDGTFWASIDGPASVPESDVGQGGPTRLIAAMRCIVRSVYGDNVPDNPA